MGTISKDPIGFAAGDANQYRYVGNGPTNATDPTGMAEGQHWVPISVVWDLFKEKVISKRELLYFSGRRSGQLLTPHNWGTTYGTVCHKAYNDEVRKQLVAWKESKNPSRVSMKIIADRIRDGKSWNGRKNDKLKIFNDGVRSDMVPLPDGKQNRMDGEGLTDDEVIKRGRSSLARRGKTLIMMGMFGNLMAAADAFGQGSRAGLTLSGRQGAMRAAQDAVVKGDLATARECLIGLNRDSSVYKELQYEVNPIFAQGFYAVVQPYLDQALEDLSTYQAEMARMRLEEMQLRRTR